MLINCYAGSSSLLGMKEISMTTFVEISSDMRPSPSSRTAARLTAVMGWNSVTPNADVQTGGYTIFVRSSAP